MKFYVIPLIAFFATSASAEAPNVATDILPVHGLVSRVMDGVGTPDLILPPGASPHGHSMRPSEAASLEAADIVFWVGPELTHWLENPINVLAADAKRVSLISLPDTILREAEEDGHDHDHDHGAVDPHAWLNPQNARIWMSEIAKALAETDPDNAEIYTANAEKADAELVLLGTQLQQVLSSGAPSNYAIFHNALGYFEDRFGIGPGIALLSFEAEKPTPQRIAEVREQVRNAGVGHVFGDAESNEALIRTVFEGTDVTFCKIDLLGAEIASGPSHYWQLLENLAEEVATCGRE